MRILWYGLLNYMAILALEGPLDRFVLIFRRLIGVSGFEVSSFQRSVPHFFGESFIEEFQLGIYFMLGVLLVLPVVYFAVITRRMSTIFGVIAPGLELSFLKLLLFSMCFWNFIWEFITCCYKLWLDLLARKLLRFGALWL
ncbi:hypothetical protein ACS0TY_022025 [Phlomoides rotata]